MPFDARYEGELTIQPPLNTAERWAVDALLRSRRVRTTQGPLDCRQSLHKQHQDVLDWNSPAEGQPSLYTGLTVSEDGSKLSWDGNEKPGFLTGWVVYLIDHLLKPGAVFEEVARKAPPGDPLAHFTFDHRVSGVLYGTDSRGSSWRIYVIDNAVEQVAMEFPHDDEAEEGEE